VTILAWPALCLGLACGPTLEEYLDEQIAAFIADLDRFGTDPGAPRYAPQAFVNWETPHVSPLALTPDGTQLLAVNTPAARLEIFDVDDEGVHASGAVPVGLDPVSVRVRGDGEAWVVNHVSDSISIVDLAGRRVVRTLRTADEPADVAFAGDRAFVVCSQANLVEVRDLLDLDAPPIALPIAGEDPRAAALSPDGAKVYVAVFESGNRTTIVAQDAVYDPSGPYAGRFPPPARPQDSPAIGADEETAPPPRTGLIVRQDPQTGRWLDERGTDWSHAVDWDLHDHDLAVIDTASLEVGYVSHLMNLNMHLAAGPDGRIAVVGTEAMNHIRFEKNLTSRSVRSRIAFLDLAALATAEPEVHDLNPHLEALYDGETTQLPEDQRRLAIADPRGSAWSADGRVCYVAGMGSNNVAAVGESGERLATVLVGQGPTGLSLDPRRGRLYVLNRFESSISVVGVDPFMELTRVPFFDPTPDAIRDGRPFLYDAILTSGLGITACASCHIDGRMDQLAWDLGAPGEDVQPFDQVCDDLSEDSPVLDSVCDDFHPLKGPMTTQTLQGAIGTEPLHWRGDRRDLAAFNPAFVTLNGGSRELAPGEMQRFEDFLATIRFPPNPHRRLDNTLAATVLGGDPQRGRAEFITAATEIIHHRAGDLPGVLGDRVERLGPVFSCNRCHQLPDGTNRRVTSAENLDAPQSMKIPQLRNLYEKTGFSKVSPQSSRGFGFAHDGAVATLDEFLGLRVFEFGRGAAERRRVQDLVAFLFSLSVDTHAGVGAQVTLNGASDSPEDLGLIALMLELADRREIGVVVHGPFRGEPRGFAYEGGGWFLADRRGERLPAMELQASAAPGAELTWTAVPAGSQQRLGIDADLDGVYDGDTAREEFDRAGEYRSR
jgi:DNA-binding beta-propeller fold protein YncE